MDKRPKPRDGERGLLERVVGKGARVETGSLRAHVILSADIQRRIDAALAEEADRSGIATPNRSRWIRDAILEKLERGGW